MTRSWETRCPKRGVRNEVSETRCRNEVSGTSRGGLRHLARRSQRTRARSSWLRLPGGLRETRCLAPREAQHLARRSQRTRTVELAPPAWWVATRQAGSATWTTHLTDTLRLHQPFGAAFAWPQPVEIVTAAQHLSSHGDPGRGFERTAPPWSESTDRPVAGSTGPAPRARSPQG